MRVIVVGAGAAGVFAAIRARQLDPALQVDVLESAAHPLGKVRISGGGRCNVTHGCYDLNRLLQHYPRGHKQLRPVLSRFGPKDTVEWFERRGVALKTEADGRIFPVSDRSETIVDCLLRQAERASVRILTGIGVTAVARDAGGFSVRTRAGCFRGDRLLLATGSAPKGYRWAAGLGHTVVQPVPSLFTFTVSDPRLTGLAGVCVESARATLEVHPPISAEGPVLITHWGLSGPAILRLSAWGARELHQLGYRAPLLVDWLPELSQEELRRHLFGLKRDCRKAVKGAPSLLPRRLWCSLATAEGVDRERTWGEVSDRILNRLSESLKRCRLEVLGKGIFKEEFVTAGGVPLDEVHLESMESRRTPGVYLAGEILNVDGLTGGFNFQNAWATGWVAGTALGGQTGV
ncbi:MAG: NAD(P)/FAD-dependent oxidoreductase [Candidatus Eremiobacterota bacterium]